MGWSSQFFMCVYVWAGAHRYNTSMCVELLTVTGVGPDFHLVGNWVSFCFAYVYSWASLPGIHLAPPSISYLPRVTDACFQPLVFMWDTGIQRGLRTCMAS